uniref:Uncharacterized protein n=1 Tax=viral metagenome TaxID=1070528 RepID=A0A6M3LQI9_9ZZZZ
MTKAVEYNTDAQAYAKDDSGCEYASKKLGRQSRCWPNCPFEEYTEDLDKIKKFRSKQRIR